MIKTDRRINLQNDTSNASHALLEICVEGPPLSTFSADSVISLWWNSTEQLICGGRVVPPHVE